MEGHVWADGFYAWYRDDELVLMPNRYAERAPSAELAGAKLKGWLGQAFFDASSATSVEKRGLGRPPDQAHVGAGLERRRGARDRSARPHP
jgi:hypothetical protein